MKCYNHHDRDAFAVCKACGKALCLECAEEYKNTYICRGSKECQHVADVDYIHYFKENSECAFKFYKYMLILLGAFLLGYMAVKSFFGFLLPFCPFGISLESILVFILAILLIKKGIDSKLK